MIGINDRQTVIDDGVSQRLQLKKGSNVIRAAIVNASGDRFLRTLLDDENRPVKGIAVSFASRQGTRGRQEMFQ